MFNDMPYDHRRITSDYGLMQQILELQRIKMRIDKTYKEDVSFINNRIKVLLNAIELK